MRRWSPLFLLVVAYAAIGTIVPPKESASAASTGGPVFLDGTDSGYHGSVFYDAAARTRTIQSGWLYYSRWYKHLLASIPSSYVNDGTIAVLGTTGFNNDADSDFQHDVPNRSYADCGVGTFEVARSTGMNLRWYDGAGAIGAFLERVEAGVERPALIHIVEHTPAAEIGTSFELCKFGLDDSEDAALATKSNALAVHVNRGGALFGNDHPYTWLSKLEPGFVRTDCAGNVGAFTPVGAAEFPMAQAGDAQSPRHNCLELNSPATNLTTLVEDALLSAAIGGSRVVLPQTVSVPTPPTTSPPVLAPIVGGGGPSSGCTAMCIQRSAGADRYETAAIVSNYWSSGSDTAVLAVGENFPDAIVGGPLASLTGAPILLSRAGELPSVTTKALNDRGVNKVFLLGGPSAVSLQVQRYLEQRYEVERLGGLDRYETSAVIARQWKVLTGGTIFMAGGTSYQSQIIAGSLAARFGSPMLLVEPSGVVPEAVETEVLRLAPRRIVVVGFGTAIESLGQISDLQDSDAVSVVSGQDQYELAINALDTMGTTIGQEVIIASGESFSDGLTGTGLVSRLGIPLLLVDPQCWNSSTYSVLQAAVTRKIHVMGGPKAVFPGIENLNNFCG